MKFTVVNAEQRSDAWHAARLGRLTGSRAADMLAAGKGGAEAAGRRNLRVQLMLERLTGRSHDRGFVSAAMQQGIEREPDAQAMYEALTGRMLNLTGFVSSDSIMAGCSLDGHVGDFEGIIEIKSPLAATHLEYLRTGVVPPDYMKQILHSLWITGARWCDWLSFNSDFPESLQVKLVRVARNEAAVADYERRALAFLAEVEIEYEAVAKLAEAVAV